jgi:hypothetical protein
MLDHFYRKPKFMKSPIRHLLLLLLLLGCQKEDKLTFDTVVFEETPCTDCPDVQIDLPHALDQSKLAKTINTALTEEVISLLLFDEGEASVTTIPEAMDSFKEGYLDLKGLFAEEATQWEARINGEMLYEDANHLTIQLTSYIFTGGAHGYTAQRFLNFDKKKGTELENRQLFKDGDGFQEFAERKFREQEHIPLGQSINQTGLMFEEDSFYLPENIGFTKDGLQLLYNPYEVGSYADGPIVLTLPYQEVGPFLSAQLQ